MISELIRDVLRECGLRQRELADLLEVPLQRVKRLAGGEVQQLTREEIEGLVSKLHIRPEWIISERRNGPMFQSRAERAQRAAASVHAHAAEVLMHRGQLELVELKNKAEVRLIEQYRSADPPGKRAIEATAAAVSKRYSPNTAPPLMELHQEEGPVTQRFEAPVGQAAARDIVNKGGKVTVGSRPAKRR